jgi:hypothetical protein
MHKRGQVKPKNETNKTLWYREIWPNDYCHAHKKKDENGESIPVPDDDHQDYDPNSLLPAKKRHNKMKEASRMRRNRR